MNIEIDENGSDAFYREVVNVFYQYNQLSKSPDRKVGNLFNTYSLSIVLFSVLGVLLFYLCVRTQFDFILLITFVIILIAAFITGFNLYNMNRLMQRMIDGSASSTLTINEEGITLSRDGSNAMALPWEKLAGVRFLKESVCFIAAEGYGIVICVQRKYENQIKKALEMYNADRTEE